MNRTIVILNLLVASIAIAKPIDETATAQIDDENHKIEDQTRKILDEAEIILKNDDLLNSSELNNMYRLAENKYAKTRSLKEELDNDRFVKADLIKQSRVATKSPENKHSKPVEKESVANDKVVEIETKAASEKESKTDGKSTPTTKAADFESKESKSVQVTDSDISELESSTVTYRAKGETSDYLENDEISERVTPEIGSTRKGFDMPINDESNSSWDLLDDLPTSRRMLSQPDILHIESKGRTGVKNVEPVNPIESKAINVPETNVETPRNHNANRAFGHPTQPVTFIPEIRHTTILIPHNHPLLPHRRFIVPGFIRTLPAVSIDFRSLLNQERNNVLNQNIKYENEYRSESNNIRNPNQADVFYSGTRSDIPKLRDSKELSNAYPFTPEVIVTSNMSKVSTVSPLFAKLLDASEHPKRFNPDFNVGNVQNIPGMPYNNIMGHNYYAVPQHYGIHKYVNEFVRSR